MSELAGLSEMNLDMKAGPGQSDLLESLGFSEEGQSKDRAQKRLCGLSVSLRASPFSAVPDRRRYHGGGGGGGQKCGLPGPAPGLCNPNLHFNKSPGNSRARGNLGSPVPRHSAADASYWGGGGWGRVGAGLRCGPGTCRGIWLRETGSNRDNWQVLPRVG